MPIAGIVVLLIKLKAELHHRVRLFLSKWQQAKVSIWSTYQTIAQNLVLKPLLARF
jgi:hypothetical protein